MAQKLTKKNFCYICCANDHQAGDCNNPESTTLINLCKKLNIAELEMFLPLMNFARLNLLNRTTCMYVCKKYNTEEITLNILESHFLEKTCFNPLILIVRNGMATRTVAMVILQFVNNRLIPSETIVTSFDRKLFNNPVLPIEDTKKRKRKKIEKV